MSCSFFWPVTSLSFLMMSLAELMLRMSDNLTACFQTAFTSEFAMSMTPSLPGTAPLLNWSSLKEASTFCRFEVIWLILIYYLSKLQSMLEVFEEEIKIDIFELWSQHDGFNNFLIGLHVDT